MPAGVPQGSQSHARGTPEAGTPHLLVETVRGREAFLKLKKAWDAALAEGPDSTFALAHDLVRLWAENFVPSRPPIVVVARRADHLAGGLAFTIERGFVDGIRVQLARGLSNAHSTRGGVLLGREGIVAIDALVEQTMEEPWDVLELLDVPKGGGVLDALARAYEAQGCRVATDRPMESPYIPLPGSWDELEKRLDSRFKQNLRRRRRRLEEHGEVTFEVITGGDALDAALEDAFTIEAGGWKGRDGSAIQSRPELVGFYGGWARLLAREGKLRLCFLSVGGKRVAFHFALVEGGRYLLPKCGYDETYADTSPGQLLMVEVLKRCIDERIETFEFLGHSMTWKRDWTPLVHPHACLWVFRPTPAGRLAGLVRAEIRPRVAATLKTLEARRHALQANVEKRAAPLIERGKQLRARVESIAGVAAERWKRVGGGREVA